MLSTGNQYKLQLDVAKYPTSWSWYFSSSWSCQLEMVPISCNFFFNWLIGLCTAGCLFHAGNEQIPLFSDREVLLVRSEAEYGNSMAHMIVANLNQGWKVQISSSALDGAVFLNASSYLGHMYEKLEGFQNELIGYSVLGSVGMFIKAGEHWVDVNFTHSWWIPYSGWV